MKHKDIVSVYEKLSRLSVPLFRVITMDVSRGTIFLHKSGVETGDSPPREFTFDSVYDDKWAFIKYTCILAVNLNI